MAQNKPKQVRRGNTSGLIGLWNRKAETENSPNVTSESLQIREEANRRISCRDPPKLEDLEEFQQHLRRAPTSTTASTSSNPRSRKTSEIQRPSFKIKEETEGTGLFASGVLKEKTDTPLGTLKEELNNDNNARGSSGPGFSFMVSAPQEERSKPFDPYEFDHENDNDQEDQYDYENKAISKLIYREGRRGSKTTDDLEKFAKLYNEEEEKELEEKKKIEHDSQDHQGLGRRGSNGVMRRSKSVKIQRVKFGLTPSDAEEGTFLVGNEEEVKR